MNTVPPASRALQFQVRMPDGRVERLVIDAPRVLIGSGGHCDIRLPQDQAQAEHVAIDAPLGQGLFLEALSFSPPPLLNGVPYDRGPLPPNAVVTIAQCQFIVTFAEAGAGVAKKKEEQTSPMSLVAFAAILIGGGYMIFSDDVTTAAATKMPPYVDLFDPTPATCDGLSGAAAMERATVRLLDADGKRERRIFHIRDGVTAVPAYRAAAACFTAGGDAAKAANATAIATKLQADEELDYRTHRVRLEHAYAIRDVDTARVEIKYLIEFVGDKPGDYATWLHAEDRRLRLKLGRPSS